MKPIKFSLFFSFFLTSFFSLNAMEQSHQDSDRIATLYESYKNTERALFQHRSKTLPLPSGLIEALLDNARKGKTQEVIEGMNHLKKIKQVKAVGTEPLREALIGGRLETFKYLAPFYNSQEQLVLATLCKTTADLLLTTALLTKDLAAIKNYLILSGDTPTVKHINQVIDFDGENIDLLKLLIDHGAPVNVTLKLTNCSISNGAGRPTQKTSSSYRESPLLLAATEEKLQVLTLLLKAGANPHRCYDGRFYYYKEDARIDLLSDNISLSPAIKQLIRDNQKHKHTCSIQ